MNRLDITNYNLEATLLGGQSFTWEKTKDVYLGTHRKNAIALKQENSQIFWQTYPENNNEELVKDYLNLNLNYDDVINLILKDDYIKSAVSTNTGVRILNQDFETVLMNFILSSHKSVKGVRKLVRDISKKYGKLICTEYGDIYSFPSPDVISKLSEKELREIGAGFRAPYLKAASEKLVKEKQHIEGLLSKGTRDLKEYLITFKGIGDKIADCILVFGLRRLDVTPLDIWGKRVLIEFYNVDPKLDYLSMSKWYTKYFGEHTAIAGQILFEYIRNLPKDKKNK